MVYRPDKASFFCHDSGMPQPSQELKEALRVLGQELQFPLFPLKGCSYTPSNRPVRAENQKTPWRKGWQGLASTNLSRLNLWVQQGAWAFGVSTGNALPDGGYLTVIDCDKAKTDGLLDGVECFEAIYEKHHAVFPDDMLSTVTPGGGFHFYFRTRTRLKNEVKMTIPMVDVRGEGGIIVAPGSRLLMTDDVTIKTYHIAQAFPKMKFYDMPEWLETLFIQRQAEPCIKKKTATTRSPAIFYPESTIHNTERECIFQNLEKNLVLSCTSTQKKAIFAKCEEWYNELAQATEGTRNSTLFGTAVRLARLVPHFIPLQTCIDLCRASALCCQQNTAGGKPFPSSEIEATLQSAIQYRNRKGSGMSFTLTQPEPFTAQEQALFEQQIDEKRKMAEQALAAQQKTLWINQKKPARF